MQMIQQPVKTWQTLDSGGTILSKLELTEYGVVEFAPFHYQPCFDAFVVDFEGTGINITLEGK